MRALFICLLVSASAFGAEQESFVKVGSESIYIRHKPAVNGAPTVVLLNGLTYTTRDWNAFSEVFGRLSPDSGLLRYDMRGMGKTLLAGDLPVRFAITPEQQVAVLNGLLAKLKIKSAHLAGLSYGGAIALAFAKAHPGKVESLILMAPFTEALEAQDKFIRSQIRATRIAFPFNPASDEELYEYFLRQFIYSTYPSAEPSILDNPYQLEAVYRMVSGIRQFLGGAIVGKLPPASVHLMVANQDQYIPAEVINRFWRAVPKSARASRININRSEHKIPESAPAFSAAWLAEILSNPNLSSGKTYEGDTRLHQARSGRDVIELPQP